MRPLNTYIDHTCLKPDAGRAAIEKLCREAAQYRFASVCVQPYYVPTAAALLAGSGVAVCTVIGFPLGQNVTATKVFEAERALADGCDEFDMVLNVAALRDGRDDYVRDEIAALRAVLPGKILKVILETALLSDEQKRRAVELACAAGADFVKTCTGFSGGGATAADVALMKAACTGNTKVKASGGIRTRADALALIEAGADRIGASAGVAIVNP